MPTLFGLGRLGRDCELRYTGNGEPVTSLALAMNYGVKKDGKQPTVWIDASLWGKRAEALVPHLTKGTSLSVVIEDLHQEEWKSATNSGVRLTGRISNLEFAGGPKQDSAPAKPARQAAPATNHASSNLADLDDLIPFN
ncbi:single-stranded DNA-binding protein [Achromobacter sp. KS-M25]|nr:single-stranded DNA-binding protein [Achromobacter aestuarii]